MRPVYLLEGMKCPLVGREPGDIDFWIVRENNEGEYSEVGGRMFEGTDEEFAVQQSIFTRRGVDRIMRYAFELAKTRNRKHVTSATKSNGIIHSMPFWDERFDEISKDYPDIQTDKYHIDILTAHFVRNPDWFDVVVGSNLFGDILTDEASVISGSMGLMPSASVGEVNSLYEPIHGSFPEATGKNIANPLATILSAAMMFEMSFNLKLESDLIKNSVEKSIEEGFVTQDLSNGSVYYSTSEVGDKICDYIKLS